MINITIKNLPEIKRAFNQAPALMTYELNKAIQTTIFDIRRGEGEWYRSLGIGIITHGLIDSISRGTYFSNLRGEVGPNVTGSPGVYYSKFVHDGTRYMQPRPFLQMAVDDEQSKVDILFQRAVQNVLDKIGREV